MFRSKLVPGLAIAAALVFPTMVAAQDSAAPQESLAPLPSGGPSESGIVWESSSARFEADSYEIHAGDRIFTGVGPVDVHSDPGDATFQTLEITWQEQSVEQRMNLYFAADDTDWWVTEIRTYDGLPVGEWINYAVVGEPRGEMLRTPLGESFEGDARFVGWGRVPGEVVIEGLQLTAFAPRPSPQLDCRPAITSRKAARTDPLKRGQPLHGSGIRKMSLDEAESVLRDLGICFTFDYGYAFGSKDPGGDQAGTSERWCTAPPAGVITDVRYLDDGELVVSVQDDEVRAPRSQPPQGWNCPAQ